MIYESRLIFIYLIDDNLY